MAKEFQDIAESLMDSGSLEVLMMATSAWLEVASLRKQAQPKDAMDSVPMAAPVHTVRSYSAPLASHVPKHYHKAPEPAEVVEVAASSASVAAAVALAADPFAGLSPEDAGMHRKAQRFARLLVDEIKLYN